MGRGTNHGPVFMWHFKLNFPLIFFDLKHFLLKFLGTKTESLCAFKITDRKGNSEFSRFSETPNIEGREETKLTIHSVIKRDFVSPNSKIEEKNLRKHHLRGTQIFRGSMVLDLIACESKAQVIVSPRRVDTFSSNRKTYLSWEI